jgi:hypothetical protein
LYTWSKSTLEPIVTWYSPKNDTVYIEENIVSAMDVVTVITKKKEVQYKDLLLHSESVP